MWVMNNNFAVTLLLDQLKDAHKNLELTLDGVTNEIAAFQPEGKANPIAGTYAHVIMSEDFFVHGLLQGKPTLFDTEWKDKTGASEIQPTEWETAYPKWLREVKVDIEEMKKYAQVVFSESEKYIESLTEEDLSKEIDMSMFGMGKRTVASVISGMLISHMNQIVGEVSVLKGIQGLKGYPY